MVKLTAAVQLFRTRRYTILLVLLTLLLLWIAVRPQSFINLWLTPDQQN